ncbi:hypothetical protein A2U01_0101239, partial [Trifolium medium]|nr:hypothetical protein [Trifolium medium]
ERKRPTSVSKPIIAGYSERKRPPLAARLAGQDCSVLESKVAV